MEINYIKCISECPETISIFAIFFFMLLGIKWDDNSLINIDNVINIIKFILAIFIFYLGIMSWKKTHIDKIIQNSTKNEFTIIK